MRLWQPRLISLAGLVALLLATPASVKADANYRYGHPSHGYAGRWKKDGYYKYTYYYQPRRNAGYKYHYVYYYPQGCSVESLLGAGPSNEV